MKNLFISIVFCLSLIQVYAQEIISVCATDTIVLQLENYENGVIEWQESFNGETWKKIPNVTGLTYEFNPVEEKYYRSVIKTSTCEPLYSDVTFIQQPPVANAGTDRVIGDSTMLLLGNYREGATGEWTLIEGNGVIEDPANHRSRFSSFFGDTCTLVWTLTNDCGVSSDTVTVSFKEINAKSNYIVVDMTDEIFSDSIEMASGIFKIKFSDPEISPVDSVVLIGMREDISFLRKVYAFTKQDSMYTFQTNQGTLEDLFWEASINIGDALNHAILEDELDFRDEQPNVFPTRETLKAYDSNKGIKNLFFTSNYRGNSFQKNGDGYFTLSIDLSDITILSGEGFNISTKEDSYVELTPNFVCDVDYSFPANFDNIKFGIDNGGFEINANINFESDANFPVGEPIEVEDISLLPYPPVYYLWVVVGPAPVLIVIEADLKMKLEAELGVGIEFTESHNIYRGFTFLIEGDDLNDLNITRITNSSTSYEGGEFLIHGDFSIVGKIGPEISFDVYDVIGPYANFFLKAKGNMCVNDNGNWDAGLESGFELNVGVKGEVLGHDFLDVERDLLEQVPGKDKEKMPHELELLSGNGQNGNTDEVLAYPISVKVLSKKGYAVPFAAVNITLEAGNGSVVENILYTDFSGVVNFFWTLGENEVNEMTISVLDCSDDDIKHSPLEVVAYNLSAGVTDDCTDSDLEVSFISSDGFVTPLVYGGTPPYTYSTDGDNYTAEVPQFDIAFPGVYPVHVIDDEGCHVSRSVNIIPTVECDVTDLAFGVNIEGNIIQLVVYDGVPPYEYAIDDQNNFSDNNIFIDVPPGEHIFYVKDAMGCVRYDMVNVEEADPALLAIYPANGAQFIGTANVVFEWLAGDYANYQAYGLYLKKEGGNYNLVDPFIENTIYAYNFDLDPGSNYAWKVVVINDLLEVLDEKEFFFSTESGNTTAPPPPVLLYPENSATLAVAPSTLNWDTQTGNIVYDLYFDNVDASSLAALNISSFGYAIGSLQSGTTYFWRVVAKSLETGETAESETFTFTFNELIPQITTNTVTDIQQTTATCGGNITYPGGDAVTSKGVCWSTTQFPTIYDNITDDGLGTGSFTSYLTGLLPSTQYFVRAYAINSEGIAYGNQQTFTTSGGPVYGTVTDSEGNTYQTIVIGNQEWMAENLNIGTMINGVNDQTDNGVIEKYCYDDDPANCEIYGGLYQWNEMMQYTTIESTQGVCPVGWHLPSDEDFKELEMFLGMTQSEADAFNWRGTNQGSKLAGNFELWYDGPLEYDSEFQTSGFFALPGGLRAYNSGYFQNTSATGFWTSKGVGEYAINRVIGYDLTQVYRIYYLLDYGCSVRCVKD